MDLFKKGSVLLLILVLSGYAVITLVEKSFDLESYSNQLKADLKHDYGLNVSYRSISLRLGGSLQVKTKGLSVVGDRFSVTADEASVTISYFSLLMGEAVVTNISLVHPSTSLERYEDGTWNISSLTELLAKGGGRHGSPVRRLSLSGGTVKVLDRFVREEPVSAVLKISTLSLTDSGVISPIRVKFSGVLETEEGRSPLKITFYLKGGQGGINWNEIQTGGTVVLEDLPTGLLASYSGYTLPEVYRDGPVTLDLFFEGDISKRMDFSTHLFSSTSKTEKTEKSFEITGNVQEDQLTIGRFEILLPNISAVGSAEIAGVTGEDPKIGFELNTPFLDIDDLFALIPPVFMEEPFLKYVKTLTPQGRLRFKDFHIAGPLSQLRDGDEPADVRLEGAIEIDDFTVVSKYLTQPVKGLTGLVSFDKGRLKFNRIKAFLGNTVLKNVSGEVMDWRNDPIVKAEVNADLDLNEFHKELVKHISSKELLEIFKPITDIYGNVEFDFNFSYRVSGQDMSDFSGTLHLDNLGFKHNLFGFPVRGLKGTATINKNTITVDKVTWESGDAKFSSKGSLENFMSKDYGMDLIFDTNGDVTSLAHSIFYRFPQLKDLKGKVSSRLLLKGRLDDLDFTQWADFTQAEYSFKEIVFKPVGVASSEIIKGHLKDRRKLDLQLMDVQLGESVIGITGSMDDVTTLKGYGLDVNVKKLRLEDFPSIFLDYMEGDCKGLITGNFTISDIAGRKPFTYQFDVNLKTLLLDPLSQLGPALAEIDPEGRVWGSFKVSGGADKPFMIKGELEGAGIGFKTWLRKPFSALEGKAVFNGQHFNATGISGRMGKSGGSVDFDIDWVDKPVYSLRVYGDEVYLDDIIDVGTDEEDDMTVETTEEKPSTESGEKSEDVWNLRISSKRGTIGDIRYSDLETDFTYEKEILDFKYLDFTAYEGLWKTKGTIDLSGYTEDGHMNEIFNADVKLNGFDLASFLRDVIPSLTKITGKMDLEGNISGNGLVWSRFSRTLDGKLNTRVIKGIVKEFDGMSQLFTYLNILPLWKAKEKEQEGAGLQFEEITGTFDFKDGIGHTDNTNLEGNIIRVSTVGDIDLSKELLDMTMGVKPFTSFDSLISSIPVAGEILTGKEKSLIVSYYKVGGTFSNPTAETMPGTSIGRSLLGILKRMLEYPSRALSNSDYLEKQKRQANGLKK